MKVNIINTKNLSEETVKEIFSFTYFVLEKYFRKPRRNKIEVDIVFVDNLEKDTGMTASCIWEDTHYRPNEFTIEIDTGLSFISLINALGHELTHVKQWGLGHFYEMVSKSKGHNKIYKFCSKEYEYNKKKYLDLPWEIEAIANSITLPLEYCHARGLNTYDYLPFELLSLEEQEKHGYIAYRNQVERTH